MIETLIRNTASAASPTGILFMPSGASSGEFALWLAKNPDVALGFDTISFPSVARNSLVSHVCFATADGHAVVVDGSNRRLVLDCVGMAVRDKRQLWAYCGTQVAAVIHSSYGARIRKLRCAMVLANAFDPDDLCEDRASLSGRRPAVVEALTMLAAHWSHKEGVPAPSCTDPSWVPAAASSMSSDDPVLIEYLARVSVECARLVAYWADAVGASSDEWHLGLLETEIDDVWRWASARGYRVDQDQLAAVIRKVNEARRESLDSFGIDLSKDDPAVRRWVSSRGIRIRDRDGQATLSHKLWKDAFVPKDAHDDWQAFKRIRRVASPGNKLTDLAKWLREDRIHPDIRGIGAQTGRMSISKPALQNLQESLRGLLLAEPGHILVGCDLNRVEPCVIAAMSQDAALIKGVKGDIYAELGVAVYGESSRGDVHKRKVAKTAFLAIAYGQGRASLAANLGLSESDAAEIIHSLKVSYPEMTRWMSSIKSDAKYGRALTTAYGRRLPRTPNEPYKAVNWVIQGTAADLFKRSTLAAAAGLGRDALYLPVHDELIVQVPAGSEERSMEILREAMTSELLGVPISGTPVVLGDRLGHA